VRCVLVAVVSSVSMKFICVQRNTDGLIAVCSFILQRVLQWSNNKAFHCSVTSELVCPLCFVLDWG